MIIVTSLSKPFTYGMKGYPQRLAILQNYQDEIEALYSVTERSFSTNLSLPAIWDKDGVRSLVRRVVSSVVKQPLTDDANFFHNGCDRYVVHCSSRSTSLKHYCPKVFRLHGFGIFSWTCFKSIPSNLPNNFLRTWCFRHLLYAPFRKRSHAHSRTRTRLL